LVLVGAQAVYFHTGDAGLIVVEIAIRASALPTSWVPCRPGARHQVINYGEQQSRMVAP
jgi:hypothetical protein